MNDNEKALFDNLLMLTEAIAAARDRLDRHDIRIANLEARIDALGTPGVAEDVRAALAELDAMTDGEPLRKLDNFPPIQVCHWAWLEEDYWSGECGALWSFPDGTPTDNGMKFCPVCGGRFVQVSQ